MNGQLVNQNLDQASVKRLQEFYDRGLVPPEKKPFLIDLRTSSGPLLAVDGGQYILDVASQIASFGLGFNSGAMFGAAQFLECWTSRTNTPPIQTVRRAFEELLLKHLGQELMHVQLCHSGAEAVETALGICYQHRVWREARQVIAFRGSFHGRMMVSLASTWNPAKREPFAWPGVETSFVDYPELPGDDVRGTEIPQGWQTLWSMAPRADFEQLLQQQFSPPDDTGRKEINSLLQVRKLLADGRHYAVLIEPMQCEGGDRYSSWRFHHALVNMTRAFRIPLIYDEIQTGLGLGGDFFWHNKFQLCDPDGSAIGPDCVVMAKKAQVGAVLSRHACRFEEQFNAASLLRGFIHASMMDQFRAEIDAIESRSRTELQRLVNQFASHISRPRVCGLSFAFDFHDPADLKQFVGHRFEHGLLYYPAGTHAARFRFNLAFRGRWIDTACQQIESALRHTVSGEHVSESPVLLEPTDTKPYFEFHEKFLDSKLSLLQQQQTADHDVPEFIRRSLKSGGIDPDSVSIVFPDERSWQDYRQRVYELQASVYEPLRQTSIEKFDRLIVAENSLAILVCKGDQIVAMAFAAPPANFPAERGLRSDPHFHDPRTVYMLDLTVVPGYRGGVGRIMKQAICLLAQTRGLSAVQGRNRDRLARSMWAINLSLGSYCTRVLHDDYLDDEEFCDCMMYRCGVDWQPGPNQLSRGVEQPLTSHDLNSEFLRDHLPAAVNKLTLSNFVTAEYMQQLGRVFDLLPPRLQHGYSASGISECVDKLVKSIWLKRKPRRRLVTIADSYFGHGSFLARSLSSARDALFDVTHLPRENPVAMVDSLHKTLADDDALAVFVEPLGWQTGQRIEPECLQQIADVCATHQTPLVSHESGGLFFRYSADAFLPSALADYRPDAGLISLGGQMAVCFTSQEYFVDTPLMLISTWDGDAFSLAQFDLAKQQVLADRAGYLQTMTDYHHCLLEHLARHGVHNHALTGGVGWFEGPVSASLTRQFRSGMGRRLISMPSPGAMRQFLQEFQL